MLNTLWTWGSALMPTAVGMTGTDKQAERLKLDDDWEILCEDEKETIGDHIYFQVVDQIPIGFASLITKRHLDEFLNSYKNDLFSYWPVDAVQTEYRGTIRVFPTRSKPPAGYLRLDRLLSKVSRAEELFQLLNAELDRLRQIEMRYPYSVTSELESPMLKGLFRWHPFVGFIWDEVVSNPWADFVILYPVERLDSRSGESLNWRESLDCITDRLSTRNPNHPKIFVNLIGPRNYTFQNVKEMHQCETEIHNFACQNSTLVSSAYFVCFPPNSTPS